MKLPTVALNRKTMRGETERMTVNVTDWARNPKSYIDNGWFLVSEARGDAPDSVVDWNRRQAEKELARRNNKDHEAYNDAKRKWEFNQPKTEIWTSPEAKAAWEAKQRPKLKIISATPVEIKKEEKDWRKLPWFRARNHVRDKTGTMPKNKAHAEELMKED